MGMLDWFKGIVRGGDNPTSLATTTAEAAAPLEKDKGAELAGLNFKTAVDAHMKWKVRLQNYINGTSDEQLSVDVVSCDDKCPLGKWIYDKGGEHYGFTETFFDVKAHHAQFHRCAGAVLAAAQAGDKEKALALLRGGDYVRASERVKMLLARMFVIAAEGREAIDTHVRWKERLRVHISGMGNEDLQADVVARDDRCVLGQWMLGSGSERYRNHPAFHTLQARHAEFHRRAGEVLSIASQDRARALLMLEEGAYPQASMQVTEAIVDLFAAPPH
jgi:hypothetical protein